MLDSPFRPMTPHRLPKKRKKDTWSRRLQTPPLTPPRSDLDSPSSQSPELHIYLNCPRYSSPQSSPAQSTTFGPRPITAPSTPLAEAESPEISSASSETLSSCSTSSFTCPTSNSKLSLRISKAGARRRGIDSGVTTRRATLATPSPTSADRFVSSRHGHGDLQKTFHLSKTNNQLSGTEKLLRNRSASPDPFVDHHPASRHGRRFAPISAYRQANRSSQRSPNGLNLMQIQDNNASVQDRQANAAAAWTMISPSRRPHGSIAGVFNGRGGLMTSGTNAPLYTTTFVEQNSSEDDLERYEGRLAVALDIDRTRKMLDHSLSSERNRSLNMVGTSPENLRARSTTQWKYDRWVREGDNLRKPLAWSRLYLLNYHGF
ncbi:MAG: hypothetical protein Q9190_007358 [Brigantiaea leucoxantha]